MIEAIDAKTTRGVNPVLKTPETISSSTMGARKSIQAGGAKIDFDLDFSNKICAALLLPPEFRVAGGPLSLVVWRMFLEHPNVFGEGKKLDAIWDKGLGASNVLVALRRRRPERLSEQSFVIQNSISPEIEVHGKPDDSFTHTWSGGINLCHFSAGVDLADPDTSNLMSTTSIRFEHVRPISDHGFPISTDDEGFAITCSGNSHDNMVVLRQKSKYATRDDRGFFKLNLQVDQGIPLFSKWLIFNRFKFNVSKGVKLGRSLLLTSITGGSIVGDMAPYQAFSIGGLGSVRGYGDGGVGSGRSCFIVNSELTVPLMNRMEAVAFMDYGSDLGSAKHVPGNPALRHGKPGRGFGIGYGLRLTSSRVQLRLDYALNSFHQNTIYFGLHDLLRMS